MWKIVGALKISVLYIYIYIYIQTSWQPISHMGFFDNTYLIINKRPNQRICEINDLDNLIRFF